MKFKSKNILLIGLAALFVACSATGSKSKDNAATLSKIKKNDVVSIIKKVNDHWQSTHQEYGRAFWDNAAYHTGNIAAYKVTGEEKYRIYSEAWAQKNEWKGAKSDDKANWRNILTENQMNLCCLAIGKFVFKPISTCIIFPGKRML